MCVAGSTVGVGGQIEIRTTLIRLDAGQAKLGVGRSRKLEVNSQRSEFRS